MSALTTVPRLYALDTVEVLAAAAAAAPSARCAGEM